VEWEEATKDHFFPELLLETDVPFKCLPFSCWALHRRISEVLENERRGKKELQPFHSPYLYTSLMWFDDWVTRQDIKKYAHQRNLFAKDSNGATLPSISYLLKETLFWCEVP